LIAHILNDNEGPYKLKTIVKENVKAVLSENKKLISVSFAALTQTIKADPQMVNLNLNIHSTNDGEHKDSNNIIKYLESNKNNILGLAEKNMKTL
jgi:predicted component of viral defense system (DUF524 family)